MRCKNNNMIIIKYFYINNQFLLCMFSRKKEGTKKKLRLFERKNENT